MGLAFKEIELNGKRYRALIDTGYNGRVLVSRRVAEELNLPIIGEGERITVDNRKVKVRISYGKLRIDDVEGYVMIEILDELPLDVLIGVIALEELGFVVDPRTGTLKYVGMIAL